MIDNHIIRSLDNGIQTTGKWYITGDIKFTCDTLERTYAENKHGISCIPAGKYICKKVEASNGIPYPHISITNVPNRDGVCVHGGNFYTNSHGCILVGKGYSDINKDGQQDVLYSRNTFNELMQVLPDEFTLTITEAQNKPFKTIST